MVVHLRDCWLMLDSLDSILWGVLSFLTLFAILYTYVTHWCKICIKVHLSHKSMFYHTLKRTPKLSFKKIALDENDDLRLSMNRMLLLYTCEHLLLYTCEHLLLYTCEQVSQEISSKNAESCFLYFQRTLELKKWKTQGKASC